MVLKCRSPITLVTEFPYIHGLLDICFITKIKIISEISFYIR